VWAIICELHGENVTADERTVRNRAVAKGVPIPFLSGLVDCVPRQAPANIAYHVDRLATLRRCRKWMYTEFKARAQLIAKPDLINNGFIAHRVDELRALELDARTSEATAFVHSLPELVDRASTITEPRWLVEGLIPGDGIVLLHSQPREYKTLIVQALLVALTAGSPAFGLERLHVATAIPAWYITEEDGWWRVQDRFMHLVRGYGLDRVPDVLHVSAGEGLNLDSPDWQERIIARARAGGDRVVVFDPLRSVTEAVDQGPRELKPFALFLRRLMRETGAVVITVHHDTKPPATVTADRRRRPQRASGGGIFSIADSPISIDHLDKKRRMLVPCAYKFAADPPAVIVSLEEGPSWLRLTGEEPTAVLPDEAAIDLRILDYLKNSPYSYGNAVAKGVHANKELVLQRLKMLLAGGLVDSVEDRKGIKWFARRAS
jgi:hypothetical protein